MIYRRWALAALAVAGTLAIGAAAAEDGVAPSLARAGGEFELGKRVYERYCVGCHGAKGDGQGEAARFLDPKPRDFTRGLFKFVSVEAGKMPRDDDLLKTITRGLRGTSMPSFRFVPEEERRAVIRYLKTFSSRWENPPGAIIARSRDPYDASLDDPKPVGEAIAKGRELYHSIGCAGCHPSYLETAEYEKVTGKKPRKDAERPILTEDSWGNWIAPPDFTRRTTRTSFGVDEIYTTITAGIGGAAMPTMANVPEEQRWQIAYYVRSLIEKRGSVVGPPPAPVDQRADQEK
ncbi:MAG TPA: c-type cytochrome [Planctomycetota bacterium]|nr:c-type cytochrome [Planctomycetota bacterium]